MDKNLESNTKDSENEKFENEGIVWCFLLPLFIGTTISLIIFGFKFYFMPEELPKSFNTPKSKEYYEKFIESKYHPQLEEKVIELEEMTENINELLFFIEYQKNKLKKEDKIFKDLTKKNEDLEPIVTAKEELVNSLFQTYENRQRVQSRYDWILGFLVGVLSSLTASAIIFLYSRYRKKKTIL